MVHFMEIVKHAKFSVVQILLGSFSINDGNGNDNDNAIN